MNTVTVYRTKQGCDFESKLRAEFVERLLDLIDEYYGEPQDAQDSPAALKQRMQAQGLSGRALARKAGISPGMLSDIYHKKVPLTDAMRVKLTQALDA